VPAIIALVSEKYYGWNWLDPVMGIAGGLVITRWFYALMKVTSPVLPDERLDLKYFAHQVGHNHFASIISLVSYTPKIPYYKGFFRISINSRRLPLRLVNIRQPAVQAIRAWIFKDVQKLNNRQ
jgi:hypothetical protein